MSIKTWNVRFGLFSSATNWAPAEAPVAGDALVIQRGAAIIANQAFGSASARSTIGLVGQAVTDSPALVLWNATLNNVLVDNATPGSSPDYGPAKHGTILVAGRVTNDGGTLEAGRGNLLFGGDSLSITLLQGATLINKGSLYASPGNQMTVAGGNGSVLENDGSINAAGGTITVSARLTGIGDVFVGRGAQHGANVELKAAVDAGQTFHIQQAGIQVDQPLSFLGTIDANLQQSGTVKLEGLTAASWDVKGSAVELFDAHGSVIDSLRFTAPPDPAMLAVYSSPDPTYGSAVVISSSHLGPPAGTPLLPYHAAA